MQKTKLKIMLIMPDGHIHKVKMGSFSRSMREAPLTLTTLAALIPEDIDAELKLIDENVESVPLDYQADIVGISVLTGTAPRAYELADYFRKKEITVLLGGVHVSLMPEEASRHADVIFTGYAERIWPEFLKEFMDQKHSAVYEEKDSDENESFKEIKIPSRNLQRTLRYNIPNTVSATRGCMSKCDFCSVPAMTCKYSKRSIGSIIDDIKSFRSRNFAFNDVSLVDDVEYAKELFTAMIPLKKHWGGLVTIKAANDPELVALMKKSGCSYLLIGFESVNQLALREIHKGFNRNDEYKKFINLFHSYNISIQGCFIFGFDHDDESVFEATVQRVNELKIDIPRYSIMTPYPGTRLHRRLTEENRIISDNWAEYDTRHVVFQPAKMSPDELYQGFCRAYKNTFTRSAIIKRTFMSPHPVISLLGNMAYRIYVGRLQKKQRLISATAKSSPDLVLPPECDSLIAAEAYSPAGGRNL